MNNIIKHITGNDIRSIQIYTNGTVIFDKVNAEVECLGKKLGKPIKSVEIFGSDNIPSLVEVNFEGSSKRFSGRDLTVIINF